MKEQRKRAIRSGIKGFVWTCMIMVGNFFQGSISYILSGSFKFSLWYIFLFALCWSLFVDAGFAKLEGEIERPILVSLPVIFAILSLIFFLSENGKYHIPYALESSLIMLVLSWGSKTYLIYRENL